MNIYMVSPGWKGQSYSRISATASLQYLAALTPKTHSVRADDESFGDAVDFSYGADLVAISCTTPQAPRGYEIADEFKRRGKAVVMGGMHPSLLPQEALGHCDSVAVGEGELIWAQMLEDAEVGALKPLYKADRLADFNEIPWPDRSIVRNRRKSLLSNVQTTRGCPFNCSFCAVTRFFGRSYRHRSVSDVVAEIEMLKRTKQLKNDFIFFTDDNIIADRTYAKELFEALAPLRVKWEGQAPITVADDDELLALARRSGCIALAIGMESLSDESLREANKAMNSRARFERAIKNMHSHKIAVYSLFIFGFDTDDESCFNDTLRFIEENKVECALLNILTPLPGTKIYEQLSGEGRIIEKDWGMYDFQTVVFEPKLMTREQLLHGRNYVFNELHTWPSIFRRVFGAKTAPMLSLINNISTRFEIRVAQTGGYVPPKSP